MGNRHIPREIKEATIRLYEADALPLAAVLDYMRLSRATFYRTYASIWLETGDVTLMLFDRSMGTKDNLIFCTFRMLTTSNISFSTDLIQVGFLTSCFIGFKRITLCHFITLRYISPELVRAGVSSKNIISWAITTCCSELECDTRAEAEAWEWWFFSLRLK